MPIDKFFRAELKRLEKLALGAGKCLGLKERDTIKLAEEADRELNFLIEHTGELWDPCPTSGCSDLDDPLAPERPLAVRMEVLQAINFGAEPYRLIGDLGGYRPERGHFQSWLELLTWADGVLRTHVRQAGPLPRILQNEFAGELRRKEIAEQIKELQQEAKRLEPAAA